MHSFPFIKIVQNQEEFYLTRMPISYLKNHVNFHFRITSNEDDIQDADKYIRSLEKNIGISSDISSDTQGIQRRTDLKRINDIADFVKTSSSIVFSTPIVLSLDVFSTDYDESKIIIDETKREFEIEDDIRFTIIDGQHRLAGLSKAFLDTNKDIELPITLILGSDLSTATKLFIDINGNQRKVNKSMIYDLYENITEDDRKNINQYTSIVRALNTTESSPFFNRIKMLGTGAGVISQSFMVDYLIEVFKNFNEINTDSQSMFSEVYIYFTIISKIYSEDWSLKETMRNNSQLVKTNGIGACLLLLPDLIKDLGKPSKQQNKYVAYFKERANFNWNNDAFAGTGKKIQKQIMKNLKDYPNNSNNKLITSIYFQVFLESR